MLEMNYYGWTLWLQIHLKFGEMNPTQATIVKAPSGEVLTTVNGPLLS